MKNLFVALFVFGFALSSFADIQDPPSNDYGPTRKLGRVDEGISYYLKSVKLDPHYAQVREYLGEAYVIKGDMARANAQLRKIKAICGTECEEYEDLAKAIAERART
jgi:predicted Zn-dependent protease